MNFKVKDYYFNKAKKENFLARSIYKLEEINNKFKVLKEGNNVVDLGYYPGSWIQYTSSVIGPKGKVVGIDIKPVNKKLLSGKNIKLLEKSIFDVESVQDLEEENLFDVLLSDMAPNTTGIKSVDQARSLELIEKIFWVLPVFLKKNGNLVIKIFDSNDAQMFLKKNKKLFKEFHLLKPKSTRTVSKEFFAIGKGYL